MIILKILAAPFVVVLTLAVAVLGFVFSLASWLFGMLSLLCAVCGVFEWFVRGGYADRHLRAGDGICTFSLWPACRGRVADRQAGRAQLFLEVLHHGLKVWDTLSQSNGGGGWGAAAPSVYRGEGCLRLPHF